MRNRLKPLLTSAAVLALVVGFLAFSNAPQGQRIAWKYHLRSNDTDIFLLTTGDIDNRKFFVVPEQTYNAHNIGDNYP